MAKQSEVIDDRYFESFSRQWFRKIGRGTYRFRMTDAPDYWQIEVAQAAGRAQWTPVHYWRFVKDTGVLETRRPGSRFGVKSNTMGQSTRPE